MSRAKELLKAGLENKSVKREVVRSGDGENHLEKGDVQQSELTGRADDLEALLLDRQPRADRIVKRTFEMRESHVDVLDKIVKRAKNNGKRITQSDALQFVISNWSDKFGVDYFD